MILDFIRDDVMEIYLNVLEMLIMLDVNFKNRYDCLKIIKQIKRLGN